MSDFHDPFDLDHDGHLSTLEKAGKMAVLHETLESMEEDEAKDSAGTSFSNRNTSLTNRSDEHMTPSTAVIVIVVAIIMIAVGALTGGVGGKLIIGLSVFMLISLGVVALLGGIRSE